jgi:RNA polymerase sigma-70 factor (ECF subfamily)
MPIFQFWKTAFYIYLIYYQIHQTLPKLSTNGFKVHNPCQGLFPQPLPRCKKVYYICDMHNHEKRGKVIDVELLFKELYRDYYLKSVFYANQYVADYELSKEIVQDSFLTLWERRESLDFNQNIGAYLIKTVRNKSLNVIRDNIKRVKLSDSEKYFELSMNQRALMDDSSSLVQSKELENLINSALNSMPEKIRDVFIMSRDKEMTYPEISSELGISLKTVEYRMSRALAVFRTLLRDYLPLVLIPFMNYFSKG